MSVGADSEVEYSKSVEVPIVATKPPKRTRSKAEKKPIDFSVYQKNMKLCKTYKELEKLCQSLQRDLNKYPLSVGKHSVTSTRAKVD